MNSLEAMRKVLRNVALAKLREDAGDGNAVALAEEVTDDDGRKYVVVVTATVQSHAKEIG